MRISVKLVAWFWAALLLGMGILAYFAYQKFHPDAFLAILQQQVQRNYPGAILEVGKLSHHIALDFNVGLKNISLRRADRIIGRLNEIELKIPWWVLLFERGNAQINLNGLEVYVDESRPSNSSESEASIEKSQLTLRVPEYLVNTKFTLRAKNISVMDLNSLRRYITISKLLVREFRYGKNSAFELNIPIEITHRGTSHLSELWLFGDVTPEHHAWDMNYRGEMRSKGSGETLAIEDVVINGKTRFLPHRLDTSSKLVLTLDKAEVGSGKLLANDSELVGDFTFTNLPLEVLGLFEDELKNPFLPSVSGVANGTLNFSKMLKQGVLRAQGALTFDGDFIMAGKSYIKGQWRIGLRDSRWETSFISPQSEVSFFRRSFLGDNRALHDQYVEELGFSGVDFTSVIGAVHPLAKLIESGEKDYFSSAISFKNCIWDEKTVNGEFKYGITPGQKFYTAKIRSSEGELELKYLKVSEKNKLELKSRDFNWNESLNFLKPYFHANTAKINGSLKGRWQDTWYMGQWASDLNFTGMSAASGSWFEFARSFWQTFGIADTAIPEQSFKGQIKSKTLSIKSLMLGGPDPANISGQIDVDLDSRSFLVLNYPKNRRWKPVKKDISEPFWKKE